jgi:hypothetical protein
MRLLLCVVLLVVAGCGATDLRYAPQSRGTVQEAVKAVEQLLWEQAPPFAPKEVVVTEEAFRTPGQKDGEIGAYYSSIKSIKVYSKKGYYITLLADANGATLFRSYHRNEEKAKQFADAVYALTTSQLHSRTDAAQR